MAADIRNLLKLECSYCLSDAIMDRFLSGANILELKKGESIIRTGETDTNVYILADGIMREWYWNGEKEVTAFFLAAGTLFISYHSYYFGKESFYTFEACTPVRLLKFSKQYYDSLIRESHEFAQWALSMAQCQIFFFEMKNRVINGTAKEKYLALLKNRPEILRSVSLTIISSYLGVTPQYLSKLRKTLS
ncbi:MAG: Crp/Fnr family transcriptional regulator [Roseburia sp.]|nr:Crp/Fnr family transcriptional regulator [Roseburia sp.]